MSADIDWSAAAKVAYLVAMTFLISMGGAIAATAVLFHQYLRARRTDKKPHTFQGIIKDPKGVRFVVAIAVIGTSFLIWMAVFVAFCVCRRKWKHGQGAQDGLELEGDAGQKRSFEGGDDESSLARPPPSYHYLARGSTRRA